jgi:hypothetical protein
MLFSLDVIRALKGDCLMLHYGSVGDPRVMLIDGGPSGVYGPHLRPQIERMRKVRGVKPNEPLQIDLLMVSHVDDDHIQGILDLTSELITAEMDGKPPFVQVLSFWHNSFENIIGNTPDELTAALTSKFGEASVGGSPPNDMTIDVDEEEVVILSSLKVVASIKQGAQLRNDIEKLAFPLNPEFDGELVLAKAEGEAIDMADGLKFTVVGPMLPELKKLHTKHQAWLRELESEGKSPEDVLSAYVDKSVPNLSSIVVLAEVEGKTMLLTGDARGDKVLKGLELVGLMEEGGKLHVDLLKVPHHGSANNLEVNFFKRITADHYVFTGNGEHGNPERDAFEMLLNAHGDADYLIHLAYPIDEIDVDREKDWKEQQGIAKSKGKVPKPDWSREDNSLAALFEKNEDFAKKVRIVEEGQPHLINLLEELEL